MTTVRNSLINIEQDRLSQAVRAGYAQNQSLQAIACLVRAQFALLLAVAAMCESEKLNAQKRKLEETNDDLVGTYNGRSAKIKCGVETFFAGAQVVSGVGLGVLGLVPGAGAVASAGSTISQGFGAGSTVTNSLASVFIESKRTLKNGEKGIIESEQQESRGRKDSLKSLEKATNDSISQSNQEQNQTRLAMLRS